MIVQVADYSRVPAYSEAQLEAAIAKQPVSVTVEADKPVFHHYTGGIINSSACGTGLDHAITAGGFSKTSDGGAYYIVRNSWGSSWGESGYVRIAATSSGPGICGI